jgi:pSer/pThr/pTyr-binding forkhead associated (FHA) protein
MSVRLTCIDAVPSASDAVLTELPVTIGRGDEADICIRDTWSSRVHSRLSIRDQQLLLEDLGSSNGTLVNGAPTNEAVLQSGDQITIGITTFRVTYSRLPESRASISADELLAQS